MTRDDAFVHGLAKAVREANEAMRRPSGQEP